MFEKEYREAFSQVKASDGLTRRVMNMKQESAKTRNFFARVALIAAVLAVMAMTVSASETVQNWFISFFAGISRDGLTTEQVEYIEENAQTILDSQTHNGWTVELHSAIRDENKAYIVFRIEGPEDVDLSKWTNEEGDVHGQVMFGNSCTPLNEMQDNTYFDFHEHIKHGGWGENWLDDGDGLDYTTNLVFHLEPDVPWEDVDPFGADTVYHFRFEDIVWFWTDLEYQQALDEGKYAGQNGHSLTDEEIRRLHLVETLAEGIWEFEISFSQLKYTPGESLERPE